MPKQHRPCNSRAPAKLILSGEYSVLYGLPALALAVNCYAQSTAYPTSTAAIHFELANLDYAQAFTTRKLNSLKEKLLKNYHSFLEGKCTISHVIQKPFELLQFAIGNFLTHVNHTLQQGVKICTDSAIPMGCGMGSSAATIISSLHALKTYLQIELTDTELLILSQAAENLQHGYSSGIDVHLALYGGCIYYQDQLVESREIPSLEFYTINTGTPEATTGECVAAVEKILARDKGLQTAFGNVTIAFDKALQANDLSQVQHCIKENHRLLCRLGIVPPTIQKLIRHLEQHQLAAKVCGAGNIKGEAAGIVMISSEENITDLVQTWGYSLQKVAIDLQGVQLV